MPEDTITAPRSNGLYRVNRYPGFNSQTLDSITNPAGDAVLAERAAANAPPSPIAYPRTSLGSTNFIGGNDRDKGPDTGTGGGTSQADSLGATGGEQTASGTATAEAEKATDDDGFSMTRGVLAGLGLFGGFAVGGVPGAIEGAKAGYSLGSSIESDEFGKEDDSLSAPAGGIVDNAKATPAGTSGVQDRGGAAQAAHDRSFGRDSAARESGKTNDAGKELGGSGTGAGGGKGSGSARGNAERAGANDGPGGGSFHQGGPVVGPDPAQQGEAFSARVLEGEHMMDPKTTQFWGNDVLTMMQAVANGQGGPEAGMKIRSLIDQKISGGGPPLPRMAPVPATAQPQSPLAQVR